MPDSTPALRDITAALRRIEKPTKSLILVFYDDVDLLRSCTGPSIRVWSIIMEQI